MYEILTTIWEFIKPFLKWVLEALPTILGGFIGFCFLSKPQREDFRFRLFEKRLKYYDEINTFLIWLKDNPERFDGTQYNKFQQLTKNTSLLFGEEITKCCDQISHCINKLDHAVPFNQDNEKYIEDFRKLTSDFSSLTLPYIDFSEYNHNGKRKKVKKHLLFDTNPNNSEKKKVFRFATYKKSGKIKKTAMNEKQISKLREINNKKFNK